MYTEVEGRNISAILNPRPVVIVSVQDSEGTYNACTAAWVTPLSHNPPMVALALKPQSRTAQIIQVQECGVINTLEESQEALAKQMGNSSGNDADKHHMLLDLVEKAQTIDAPCLKAAAARLECKLVRTVETGDHLLFIFEVVRAETCGTLKDNILYSEQTLLMVQRETFTAISGAAPNENNRDHEKERPLFSLREAREAEIDTINYLLKAEGFFTVETIEGITVAANASDELVGFIRILNLEDGFAYVYPVAVFPTWQGYGVGKALTQMALDRYGKVKLVSRGYANGFYERLGFKYAEWEDIDTLIVDDCNACELLEECKPTPYVFVGEE